MLTNCADLDGEAEILGERSAGLFTQLEALVADNARRAQDQNEYNARYNELRERYDGVKARQAEIANEKKQRSIRREKLLRFIETLRQREALLAGFDEHLWRETVDRIAVHSERDIAVKFRDGHIIHCDVRLKKYAGK